MRTHTLEQAKSTRTYHDGTPVPQHRIDNAEPRDWREEVKASRYKYPLKYPTTKVEGCRTLEDAEAGKYKSDLSSWNKRWFRKLFRQQMRMLDREIAESEPSETFTYTVAKVKTGRRDDWHFYETCPGAKDAGYTFATRYWKGFDVSGPIFFHVRGPGGFALVLRLDENGLSEPLSSELDAMPPEVMDLLRENAAKVSGSDRHRIDADVTRSFPTYGPSEEGQSLAMQLQADYGLRADNMLEED